MFDPRPGHHTSLEYWPYVLIRFRCDFCHRGRDAKLALCVARFGPDETIGGLFERFRRQCWRHRTPATGRQQKYGIKCTAEVLDCAGTRPPDVPAGLRLIKTG